ncbi:MAG: PT domain-containing protein, partial [Selenomonadaceae bacterium]|nr:PT domain-containing protein [Selenomonadaceae bacterium]
MDRLKQIEQLRQSLNDLRGRSVSLKKNFAVFGEAVDAEKFVTSKTLTSLGDEFFGWMNAEALCLKKYAQLFTGGKPQNMPQTFSDIEEVLDAEEKKIRETSVVFQAERFLHFTTNNPDLKKILLGHKKELSKLLDRKRQGVKFKSIIEPYAKFFKAAIETDFGKKFAASKDLSATFDDDFIGRGIFGGELIFTDDAPTTKPIDAPTTKPIDELTTKPADEPTTKPADELTLEPVVKVRKKPGRKPKAKPVDEKISAPVEEPTAAVEESDFVKIIKSKDALLTESDFAQWEKLFTVDKKDRTKKFSAVQFKREFPNADMMKPVLTHTALHGMLIAPELCPRKMPTDIVENFALSLVKKGYLQQYTVEGFVNFYGLTKNFFDFARTDTGKKFITAKPSERNKLDTTSFLEVDLFRAVTRAAYMKLRNIEKEHERLFYEAEFGGQWFRADFAIKDEHDTIIGCFWDTPDECDKFIRRMKNYFKKTIAPLTRVIVVSLTWLNAVKIFDALKESLPEIFPKDAAQYLYALNDDAFYRGGSTEKISADEIWKTTSPEPTDDPQPEKISDDDADVDDAAAEQNELSPTNAAVKNFLLNKKFYCATAYLKAQTLTEEDAHIYRQLAFAVDDPFINEGYSANAISILASKSDTKFNEALITAAALRALFYNDFIGDHGVPILHAQVSNFDLVKKNAPLAELIDELKNFKATVMKGVDLYADYKTQDKASTEKNLAKIIGDATDYHTRFFEGHFTDSADNETFIRMQKIIFDRKGDFAQVFRLIKDKSEIKSADTLQLVKDFLTETFLQEGATVEAVNIDEDKLEKIIDDGWDSASDRKNPGKVLGKLRNNITKNLERAVEIMCAWVNCAEIFSTTGEDAGSIAYKKIRSRLLKNATDARDKLAAKIKTKTFEAAGIAVVDQTLQEISARLDGKYNPLAKKYFYVDFLRGDKIVLDENFLPKLDLNITDGTRENISEQIIAHAASKLPTFEERIEQIFEEGGDDFGSAQLIDDYLKFRDGSSFIEQRYDLQKCINSAAKDAPRRRESFIGGLELAQCYGQFDKLPDGEKEKILQLAE